MGSKVTSRRRGPGSRFTPSVAREDDAPLLLDLYCGGGGAGQGYRRAGFRVVGVDHKEQYSYAGGRFVIDDALNFVAEHGRKYAFIHASPPCQADCTLIAGTNAGRGGHVSVLAQTREALLATGRPFVIEQPSGLAQMRADLLLCGEMFGLDVIRHRIFEAHGWTPIQPRHVPHRGRVSGTRHGEKFSGPYVAVYGKGGGKGTVETWKRAMGVTWRVTRRQLAEMIPPVYTEFIGEQVLQQLHLPSSDT